LVLEDGAQAGSGLSRPTPRQKAVHEKINARAAFMQELEGGGSLLMTQEQYVLHAKGQPMIGRPDGQFMTSAKRMNQILATEGDDTVAISRALGLNDWTADTRGVRMDVLDPLRFRPRLPSRTMKGANASFKAGGDTSGGAPEIATDQLPASAVWATPLKDR
jgi:hypothetical protein